MKSEYIDTLVDVKEDIKTSITEREALNIHGYDIEIIKPILSGGLVTYADAIKDLWQLHGYDFSWIYDEEEEARANYLLYGNLTDCFQYFTYTSLGYTDFFTSPALNTSKVENFERMLSTKSNTVFRIKIMDCSSAKNVKDLFCGTNCDLIVEGFYNLGKQPDLVGTETLLNNRDGNPPTNSLQGGKIDLATGDQYYALRNIVNNLYDRASAGYEPLTIYIPVHYEYRYDVDLSTTEAAKLVAIATQKGWIVTGVSLENADFNSDIYFE